MSLFVNNLAPIICLLLFTENSWGWKDRGTRGPGSSDFPQVPVKRITLTHDHRFGVLWFEDGTCGNLGETKNVEDFHQPGKGYPKPRTRYVSHEEAKEEWKACDEVMLRYLMGVYNAVNRIKSSPASEGTQGQDDYLSILSASDYFRFPFHLPYVDRYNRVMFPGTIWCGAGNRTSDNSKVELGRLQELDRCCYHHDTCEVHVVAGDRIANLKNNGRYTRSHCKCDYDFEQCLREAEKQGILHMIAARAVRYSFFTVLNIPCLYEASCLNPYTRTKACTEVPDRDGITGEWVFLSHRGGFRGTTFEKIILETMDSYKTAVGFVENGKRLAQDVGEIFSSYLSP